MKASYALLSKLFFCAAFGFLISATGVLAQGAAATPDEAAEAAKTAATKADGTLDEDKYVAELVKALGDATLANIDEYGTAFVNKVGAQGSFFESIAFEVISAAIELGATTAEVAALQTALANASPDSNAGALAQSAFNDLTGSGDTTARGGGVNASAPVSAGAPAGGQDSLLNLPAGCSEENFICIAEANGLTVLQVQVRIAEGAGFNPVP